MIFAASVVREAGGRGGLPESCTHYLSPWATYFTSLSLSVLLRTAVVTVGPVHSVVKI